METMKNLFSGLLILQMLTCEFVLGMPFVSHIPARTASRPLPEHAFGLCFCLGLSVLDNNGAGVGQSRPQLGEIDGSHRSILMQIVERIFSYHLLNSVWPSKTYGPKSDNNSKLAS